MSRLFRARFGFFALALLIAAAIVLAPSAPAVSSATKELRPKGLRVANADKNNIMVAWRGASGAVRFVVSLDHHRVGRTFAKHFLLRGLTCGSRYLIVIKGVAGRQSRKTHIVARTAACGRGGGGGTGSGGGGNGGGGGGNPAATPTPNPGNPNALFASGGLPAGLNHSNYGTYSGATQACDLTGKTGILHGSDVNISFTSGGTRYSGCYSINNNAGASPAGGAKRPAVFVFGSGLPRKPSTSQEVTNAGNQPNGIIAQGKKSGWDMIYIGMFRFGSQYGFTYDQVYEDYLDAVIKDLIANHGTDPARIYAFGSSAGGSEPIFMACHLSGRMAAVVSQGAAVQGPNHPANVPVDRCTQPPNPVSVMWVWADKAFPPQGNPAEGYNLHVSPTDSTISSADATEINTGRAGQVFYAMLHASEGWALWTGCAANLVGRGPQTVTVGVPGNQTPNSKLYQWTGCLNQNGGKTGEVDAYIMPGGHGIEDQVQDDGRAFSFLKNHSG